MSTSNLHKHHLSWPILLRCFLVCLTVFLAPSINAQINVPLSGSGQVNNKFPVMVADFDGNNGIEIANIIAADLTRSGQFEVTRVNAIMNADNQGTPNWNTLMPVGNGQNIVYGVASIDTVYYHFVDTSQHTTLQSLTIINNNIRHQAHKIADAIYQQTTGIRGAFDTKIAYISGHTLYVADADGFNPQAVVTGSSFISPAWSPDGTHLAYVSFESGKPVVYTQNLSTGQRKVVANFKGNNSAPAWSPNGQQLAVALSKDALSNIYLISSQGGSYAQQITTSHEIDTEPYFFPNGSGLIFTSDRGGSPQIYRTGLSGGEASRITFNGAQNISGKISPDGTKLVYTSLRGGSYSIAINTLGSASDQLLTYGPNDFSPSFSPNGMHILYVSGGKLALVNTDGSFATNLPSQAPISSVVWGPFTE